MEWRRQKLPGDVTAMGSVDSVPQEISQSTQARLRTVRISAEAHRGQATRLAFACARRGIPHAAPTEELGTAAIRELTEHLNRYFRGSSRKKGETMNDYITRKSEVYARAKQALMRVQQYKKTRSENPHTSSVQSVKLEFMATTKVELLAGQ